MEEDKKKKLTVGVIGCGMLAQMMHLPHLKQIPGVQLKWVCDANPATLTKVAQVHQVPCSTQDYRQVIQDCEVDAIVLATTQELRLPIIEAVAKAGVGIYCEKPMANTLEEMAQIQSIVGQRGIVFCVGHNRRSAPAMRYAHDVFTRHRRHPVPCTWRFDRNSTIRTRWPEEDQAFMVCRINDDLLSWKEWATADAIMATGPMLFEMTHFADLACWFLESAPVGVTTVGHLRANQTVVIEFADGSLASILMTGVGTFGYPKELYEWYANGGVVVLDHFTEVRTAGIENADPRRDFSAAVDPHPEITAGGGIRDHYAKRRAGEQAAIKAGDPLEVFKHEPIPDKGHRAHLAAFLEAVRHHNPHASPCTCAESVLATKIAFAAIESLKTGRKVVLEPSRAPSVDKKAIAPDFQNRPRLARAVLK